MNRTVLSSTLLAITLAAAHGCTWESETPGPSAAPTGTPVARVELPELFLDPEADPDEGAPPLTVKFHPHVEDNLGPVEECEWDFGDGSPKEKGLSPTHVYAQAGDYEVSVTCRDAEGITGEGEVDVFVDPTS